MRKWIATLLGTTTSVVLLHVPAILIYSVIASPNPLVLLLWLAVGTVIVRYWPAARALYGRGFALLAGPIVGSIASGLWIYHTVNRE